MSRDISPETVLLRNDNCAVVVLKHSATVRDKDGDLVVSWEDCEHQTCRGQGLQRFRIGEGFFVLVCQRCGERFYLPAVAMDDAGFLVIPEEPPIWRD